MFSQIVFVFQIILYLNVLIIKENAKSNFKRIKKTKSGRAQG